MPPLLLLSLLIQAAISIYWVLAIVVVAAVGFVALLNWLLTRLFLGNRIKFLFWLMVVGTIIGAIGFCLQEII